MIAGATEKGRVAVSWIVSEEAWAQLLMLGAHPDNKVCGLPITVSRHGRGHDVRLVTLSDLTA
jgi:LmbE family N-acetylglucosaminyl deacetylase